MEYQELMEKKNKECEELVEKKNKEHSELKVELQKLRHGVEYCMQSLLQVEHKYSIKGALKFICMQVMIFIFVFLSVLAI